ncbi:MAG: STAS domain-containing protein [Planctomycetota bacterium]
MSSGFSPKPLEGLAGGYELPLRGRVYADRAPELRQALDAVGPRALLVDASELEQIDSSGLGVFIDLLKRVRDQGGRIAWFGLNPDVVRVFQITRLDSVMPVCGDRAQALAQVQHG